MKKIFVLGIMFLLSLPLWAQKKVLDHSVYDGWKSVSSPQVTANGQIISFGVESQEGDGKLIIKRLRSKDEIVIERGYGFSFTPDGKHAVCMIKPLYQEVRNAKIKKKRADEMPKDSLAVIDLHKKQIRKFGAVSSYKMGEMNALYVAFATSDTALIAKRERKDKKMGKPLLVYHFSTGHMDTLLYVKDYTFNTQGSRMATVVMPPKKKKNIVNSINVYELSSFLSVSLSPGMTYYTVPNFDESGTKITYLASKDTLTSGSKHCSLYLHEKGDKEAQVLIDSAKYPDKMPAGWAITENGGPQFSENSQRIFVGIAPVIAPKDTTIIDFETAALDVWHYKDAELQPMQLIKKQRDLKRIYLSFINLDKPDNLTPLTLSKWESIRPLDGGNSPWAVSFDSEPYKVESNWEGSGQKDVSMINMETGAKKRIAERVWSYVYSSPDGKYLLWFGDDKQWYCYDIAQDKQMCLTNKCGVSFAEEEFDKPMFVSSYGIAGWTEGDKEILLYDRYDIWKFTLDGKSAINLTQGQGRKDNCTFRYLDTKVRTGWEKDFIRPSESLLLTTFDNTTKKNGYATMKVNKANTPVVHTLDSFAFSGLKKAKDADVYIYQKANFNTSPNMYVTRNYWEKEQCLSDINPQMKEYNWGTAELVSWNAFDGTPLKGLLYKPEDFDAAKKYPMIIYFYEKKSDTLYDYYAPSPSRSTVNIPFFCSRGYLVFVPDIVYNIGTPGESAYNCIVSGAESLCKNSWVDRDNMAIQGQSWGGYQVSYLVTRTNMFKAAGAGAPVSNMTSAYGGIRWESGDCRQFQYEHTQSRIGKSLWEAPELYIANSPLFKADKVETPLLIMHNDNDGAVPWYQGIEYFTALRRLGKKVWMLQYNNEAHNLVQKRNRRDLSVRLQQFFDHYLKGDPMPAWMKTGVPATRKGEYFGFETE